MLHLNEVGACCIVESTGAAFEPRALFPDCPPDLFSRYPKLAGPGFWSPEAGKLVSSIHSWILSVAGKTVLVDACAGRGKSGLPERLAPFQSNLAAANISVEDVDIVFLTHLHSDHVGWTMTPIGGEFSPTFPKARYLIGRAELAHWSPGGKGLALYPDHAAVIRDAVAPLLAAGIVDLVDEGDTVLPGVETLAVPGHTETQLGLLADIAGTSYIFAADAFHHPLQIYRPDLGSRFCEDQAAARATRDRLLALSADTGALLAPSHFGPPRAVKVVRRAEGYDFEPAAVN